MAAGEAVLDDAGAAADQERPAYGEEDPGDDRAADGAAGPVSYTHLCPFCINKQEYENPVGFSLEKICESIRTMDEITPKCDFVFTGGEPFADLDALQTMLDQIPTTHRVFINTTLPTLQGATEDDLVAFTEKNKDKITCINCSRHVVKYVAECSDDIFSRIAVPVRVNCVLYKDYPKENLKPYLDRFKPCLLYTSRCV